MTREEPLTDDDAAEKRVEETREQLDRHLDELAEKLKPSNLASSALDQLQPADRIKRAVKRQPIWAALAGLAIGLFALRILWRRKKRHS